MATLMEDRMAAEEIDMSEKLRSVDEISEDDSAAADKGGEPVDNSTAIVDICQLDSEAVLNENFYACFKNEFVRASQESTLREAKLLRIIISQVVEDDTDFRSYKVKVTDLADILDLKPSSLYRDARKICEGLHTKIITIQSADGRWETLNWLSRSYYDKAYIHITLNDALKPYLLNLKSNFTRVKVKEFLKFSSFYGMRLYECLKSEWNRHRQKKTKFGFAVDLLRQVLLTDTTKLKNFGHFKDKALNTGVESINNNPETAFTVTMETENGYRNAVEKVIFTITPRENNPEQTVIDVL